jgi:thiol-disulfide isomerase/thioredoxin
MKRRELLIGTAMLSLVSCLPAGAQAIGESPIGLILVGASWCPFCKSASGTLFAAAGPAELPVLVASKDGKAIPPYSDFVDARGHPFAKDVVEIPTLLFVHLPTQTLIGKITGFKNPRAYLSKIRAFLTQAQEAGYV